MSPAVLLGIGLTVLTLITALSGLWHYNYELAHQVSTAKISSVNSRKAAGADIADTDRLEAAQGSSGVAHATAANSPHTAASKNTTQNNATQTSLNYGQANNSPAPAVAINVTLSINGGYKGNVKLLAGSNQCDVLTQALATNIISSLDMRYSSQYKTQGVYVIDGIGDAGTIWWTYKVNGSAPPYGCGVMTAHDGDSVNWQYVKN